MAQHQPSRSAISSNQPGQAALRRSLTGITQHTLTMQLRELDQDRLVSRTAYAEKPLRVEYELTDAAGGVHGIAELVESLWRARQYLREYADTLRTSRLTD